MALFFPHPFFNWKLQRRSFLILVQGKRSVPLIINLLMLDTITPLCTKTTKTNQNNTTIPSMPPCAPQATYHRSNLIAGTSSRRVIFPTLYEDSASPPTTPLPEMIVAIPLQIKKDFVSSTPPSLSLPPTKTMLRPPLSQLLVGLPEGVTPPRRLISRRSILTRFPPLSLDQQFPEPTKPRELVSILRASSFCSTTSTSCSTDSTSTQSLSASFRTRPQTPIRRSSSEPGHNANRIQFDPRIWIREFERSPEEQDSTWYNDDDMDRFKRHAVALIMACKDRLAPQFIPTGTGRTVSTSRGNGAFYTHSALATEWEENLITKAMQNDRYRATVAQQEIKRILLVDPHDICISLFSKAFLTLLPKVEIVSASSAAEAMEQLALQPFDVLVVEERLQPFFLQQQKQPQKSGSDLFQTLQHLVLRPSLWIGVSAHLSKDQSALEQSGADFCWGKPPPKMTAELRNQLLQALLLKRGKKDFCRDLFGPV